jgi:hypothetical protein
MALNPTGAISLGGPVTGQSISLELRQSATATISLGQTDVRALALKISGAVVMPNDFWGKTAKTKKAIFGFGATGSYFNITNLVSSTGTVAANSPGVGTNRNNLAGATYGEDKAIFGFGRRPLVPSPPPPASPATNTNVTNLVSNLGVVASDTPGVGTSRSSLAAAGYGGDKAIFGFGSIAPTSPNVTNVTNLVSNLGVVATDTPGIGTARSLLSAASYGGDKAIFGFGSPGGVINLVSNTGVVAANTPVVPSRSSGAGAGYGGDKAIFGFGREPTGVQTNVTNLVSNLGVVAADTPGVGTSRTGLAAAGYGSDKAIFGFGVFVTPVSPFGITYYSTTNLVSNTGVVAADTPGVGTAREGVAAAGYSITA